MKQYVVLYFEDGDNFLAPFAFVCQAEDDDHAKEQCINTYPDCEVVWVEQGTEEEAFDNYWNLEY